MFAIFMFFMRDVAMNSNIISYLPWWLVLAQGRKTDTESFAPMGAGGRVILGAYRWDTLWRKPSGQVRARRAPRARKTPHLPTPLR